MDISNNLIIKYILEVCKLLVYLLIVNFINPHDILYYNEGEAGFFGQATVAPDDSVYKKSYPVPLPSTLYEPLVKKGRQTVHNEYKLNWEKGIAITSISKARRV